ncbi:hypothetical protein WFZ85_13410 [Flavobacterium sp. j3]|uniref:Uncharacterized protein n=1 Tax=Flavobacterium aureirubrum TaxID=3133147 RepID=A0ABU9N7F6_9FLAO
MNYSIAFLLFNLAASSLFVTSVRKPHNHCLRSIDAGTTVVKMNVYCTNSRKYYQICGIEKNDLVYSKGKKVKNSKKFHLTTVGHAETERFLSTIASNLGFHKNRINDTVFLKIVKQDSTIYQYKFVYSDIEDNK